MAAPGSLVKEFCEEATCPICLDYFTDPVTTECGHNFCRACLTQCWGEPDRPAPCPECREPVQQSSLRPNRKLANIAEISKKFSLQEPPRPKGAEGVCERHQEPLKLFCRDDEAPICVVCDRSKEHREHRVIPVEEAAEDYKEKIQAQLQSLERGREKLVQQKVTEEQRSQEHLTQVEQQKQEMTSVFKAMHLFLEEKERSWLTELADLEKEIKKRREESRTKLSEEISHFDDVIKDVAGKCQQLPSEFLQDVRRTLSRCQKQQARPLLEPPPGLEWRLRSCCLNSSVLTKAMEELEGSLQKASSKVSVTLDPDTAFPYLVLSEDLRSVRGGCSKWNVSDNPERFDAFPCVLGRERFTSGRHCWEVEVENMQENWAVGVTRESLNRKRSLRISPDAGIWVVGQTAAEPHQLWAFDSPAWTPLALSSHPKKIRMFLDYEEGRVEFFDADTDTWMFAFAPISFSGEGIRPFFWVGQDVCMQC